MSDINVIVNDTPINVNASNYPINVNVSENTSNSNGANNSFVTGVSGVLQNQITNSGAYLLSQIHISNAGINSLNGLSGIVNLTGLGSNTITINGQTIRISGSAVPVNVSGYITTGDADGRYYLINNPQSYIKSGEVIGIYYPLTNPNGFITGFNSGIYTLNSQTGNFTGLFLTRLETGQFNTGNLIGYATINNLNLTGSNLDNKINSLSGQLSNNIGSTGSYLFGLINASSAGVSSLNSQSGAITFTGAGNTTIIVNGQNFIISGIASGGSIINNNTFYVNSGSGIFIFQTNLSSGIDKQFINFPTILDNNPTVINSIRNSNNNNILYSQISGISTSGYWIILSDLTNDTGYILNSYAANSTGTGLNTTIIINNFIGTSSGQSQIDTVYTSGNQIISGLKTFTTGIIVPYISGGTNYIGGLLDSNGVISNDWISRTLNDSNGVQSVSYDIKVLRDNIQNYSIEWGNRFLRNAIQDYVLDWNNRILSGNWTKDGNYILTVLDSGNIQSQINSLSGYTNNTFYLKSNPEQYIKSGDVSNTYSTILNVQNTGQGLYNLLTGASGQISTNLGTTGSFLLSLINASSAGVSSLNSHSGALSLTGLGNVIVIVNGQNFTISGDTGNLIGYATVNNLSLTGQQAWTAANVNSINLSGNLQSTGSILDNKINSLSGYSNNIFATQTSLNTTNSNLTSTGVTLGAKIDSLSGYSNSTFSTILNVQNTGQSLYNLVIGLSGKLDFTGTNLQSQVNTLTNNLTQSGVAIEAQINSLSGYSNNTFATITNLASTGQQLFIIDQNNANNLSGSLTTSGHNLYILLTNLSGANNNNFATITNLASTGQQLFNISQSNGINISGNLQSTGQNLYNLLTNASGALNSSGTLDTRLFNTGSNLFNDINGLSGIINNVITNLQSTGQQTYNLIVNLSGRLDATGTNLQNQINNLYSKNNTSGFLNYAVTGISVTGGQSITGIVNLTGIGGFNLVQSGNIIILSGGGGSIINNNNNSYYINSGSGLFVFQTNINSGINQQFITFPTTFSNNPTILNSLSNNFSNSILGYQSSGITTTGFWILFSNTTNNTGYILNTSVANSTGTGLATTVIINNNIRVWSTLTWANPVIWNAALNIVEDRQILNLTGNTTLNISGLYNGWAGVLKVKQQFSGFTLALPASSKVINSGVGAISLTTGVSGAIDVIGFEYDGTDLMVAIGNNFN